MLLNWSNSIGFKNGREHQLLRLQRLDYFSAFESNEGRKERKFEIFFFNNLGSKQRSYKNSMLQLYIVNSMV